MFTDRLFATFVVPSLERVPVADLLIETGAPDATGRVVHRISQNIFTAFDACLSRHFVALSGNGLPGVTVETRAAAKAGETIMPGEAGARYFPTLPDALVSLAAEGFDNEADPTVRLLDPEGEPATGRLIGAEDVHALCQAVALARQFGPVEFSELGGDFDMAVLSPPGASENISIDLLRGTVTLPAVAETASDEAPARVEAPLFSFAEFVQENTSMRVLMARLRQALMREKTRAVLEFRAMAEDRIRRFDQALDGQPLEYHRLDAAMSLIARLKAGLGDDLLGLSEDAQIIALDWSAAVDRAEQRRSDLRASSPAFAPINRMRVTTT
ncbi:MAG: hypothetical protein AAGI13_08070 [Pseudomonadota bacterium]